MDMDNYVNCVKMIGWVANNYCLLIYMYLQYNYVINIAARAARTFVPLLRRISFSFAHLQ